MFTIILAILLSKVIWKGGKLALKGVWYWFLATVVFDAVSGIGLLVLALGGVGWLVWQAGYKKGQASRG